MKRLFDQGGAFAELVLTDLMKVGRAWDMLHDPEIVGALNMEEYLDLCLEAGYSQEASQAAAKEWGLKRMRKDLPV